MAVVGVDLGSQSTKAVILEGDEIVGGASLQTGESAETEARMTVMEALARHYVMGRPVDKHNWNSDGRLEFIGELAEQYKVDGIVSQIVRFCTYNGWDKFDLKKQMQERGIPMLELDLEYGHPAGAQVKIRAEAFMEMLETRAS